MKKRSFPKRKNRVRKSALPRLMPTAPIKYFDTHIITTSIATLGYAPLSHVPQGVGQQHRTVDTIFPVAVDVKVVITMPSTDITNQVRWILFDWIPNDYSQAPGPDSIVTDTLTIGTLAPHNFVGRQQYRIRADYRHVLAGTSSAPTSIQIRQVNRTFKLNGSVNFLEGLTNGYRNLYFVHYSDSAISPSPSFVWFSRLWFYDQA